MRPKTYHVVLASEQRDELIRRSTSQRQSARERKRARILRPLDGKRPLVYVDEASKQLLSDARRPLPM